MPFCAGIVISGFSIYSWVPGIICLAAGISGILISAIWEKERRALLSGISVFLLLAGSGYMLHHAGEKQVSLLPEKEEVFLIRLKNFPQKKSKSYSFFASIEASGKDLKSHPYGNLLVYLITDSLKEKWEPGDRVRVKLTPSSINNSGNPCEFNYSRYMAGHQIKYYGFIHEDDILSHSSSTHRTIIEYSSLAARRMIESFSSAGLKGDDLGLVAALTIGEKEFLDREYLTSFSRAGVMHVMAVSGLHVGMISLFLSSLLFFLNRRMAIAKTIIILIALWSFAFITGLSPSVMRATLMFSFIQAGTFIKRPGNSLNLLLASAFILLAARPSVLFEAGFQLSYIAVLFIILFYEPFYSLFKIKNRLADYLWQMVAVSTVAQAGTFPLVVKLFNTFPLLFLISNLVIIPLSFLIMILAFILIPFSGVEPISHIIVMALSFLSHITLSFTALISKLPFSVIPGIGFTTAGWIILTIAMALFLTSTLKILKINLRPFLAAMILFLLTDIYTINNETRKEGVVVYSIKGKALPAFQTGRYISLLSDTEIIPVEVTKHACARKLKVIKIFTGGKAFKATSGSYTISGSREGTFTLKINNTTVSGLSPGTSVLRTGGSGCLFKSK